MTDFSLLAPSWRLAIAALVFIATLSELALFLYKFVSTSRKRKTIPNAIFFILLLMLLSALTVSASPASSAYPLSIPWLFFPIFAVVIIAHSLIGIFQEYIKNKERLSSSSVKEALDNIQSGISFADESGRLVLTNFTMNNIIEPLLGSNPQFKEEIFDLLSSEDKGIKKLEDYDSLYLFPDGRVWRIFSQPLSWPGLDGHTQISAYDVTEVNKTNLEMKENNEKLRKTNEQMKLLYERLADGIREQENLNLKIRIHNDIGTSLLSISKIMEDESSDENVDSQLKALEDAVSYFSNDKAKAGDTWEDVVAQAKEMNVSLILQGELPVKKINRKIINTATSEVITNCVRHAQGNRVVMKTENKDGAFRVIFTNNGNKPSDKIKEGVGLSSLRKLVENHGGTLKISHSPVFSLDIRLPEEE